MATPIVNSLGPSGYPALQTFLHYVLNKKVFSGKKTFFILLTAVCVEMMGEVF